jgi:hypothetical protein
MSKNKPSFFIIGAPKCGTTAMSEYLKEHPNIFITEPKEPHYFANDYDKYRALQTLEDYEALFDDASKEETMMGEASIMYLYSDCAVENIKAYNKDAKIIMMLRKPSEMVYSFHAELFHSSQEDVSDFEKAVKLEANRKIGKDIPKHHRSPKLLYYSEVAKYGEQIERVYKHFDKSQVKIIFFDDFKKDVKKEYDDLIKFLELPSHDKDNFEIINPNAAIKNEKLHLFLRNLPAPILGFGRTLKKILGIEHINLRGIVKRANTVEVKREPLSQEMKEYLIQNYREDILKLSEITDRDLSSWLK